MSMKYLIRFTNKDFEFEFRINLFFCFKKDKILGILLEIKS